MRKSLILFLILFLLLFVLTGCQMNQEEYSLDDKVTEEIKYMETKLIGIVKDFAISDYDFEKVMKDTQEIEESSNRVMVDLATENIDNEEISKLSDGINNMILAASSEDEITYLVELNNVFSLFPNYEAKISNDSDEIFDRRLKYFTLSTYIAFLVGDKELSKTQVQTLENEFLEKQKNVEYVEEHKYNLNKIYLLIEELKNAIEADSSELVKEKYLLLINEI